MRIDPHVHSKAISRCSNVTYEEIIDFKKSLGYDGAVLTNHCQPWYYTPDKHGEFMKAFVSEYINAEKYAKSRSFRLFLGIEISVTDPFYADFLLYGADEKFLLDGPCWYLLSQKSLYEYCRASKVLLVQAHPFRDPIKPSLPSVVDGYEINAQPHDYPFKKDVEKLCRESNMLVTSGTDFHSKLTTVRAGMIVDDGVCSSREMADSIIKEKKTKIFYENQITEYPYDPKTNQ